jgi:hypothetical protein
MTNKLSKPGIIGQPIAGPFPEVGQWYWVTDEDGDRWFGCATHIGSNYVEIRAPEHTNSQMICRVHCDEFWDVCEHEPNAQAVICAKVDEYQGEVNALMGRVREITARLGVAPSPALAAGEEETRALAIRGQGDGDMHAYRDELVKAQADVLPDLFKQIRSANENLATWMSANMLPLQAMAKGLEKSLDTIKDRIFSVQLYAGLVETVERIADGEPADLTTPIHVMQRRHYMDEECLANYQAGGMDFEDVSAFDRWLVKPENMHRILPFERCVVAFRIRHHRKEREMLSVSDFIRILGAEQADKATLLYLRNGDIVYRMRTGIEFDEGLFPDMERSDLGEGKIWAKMFGHSVDKLISDNEYKAMREEQEQRKRDRAAWEASLETPEAMARAKRKGLREPDRSCTDVPWVPDFYSRMEEYIPFDPANVHYDDIAAKVAADVKAHNRVALVLQGLLDRSEVFHPHPPWQIWTQEGFETALRLVYDKSRTLTTGDAPDFEAYRRKLNASIKAGSITVGQEDAWLVHEAQKYCERLDSGWARGDWRPERYRPHNNPGPGVVARVVKCSKGKCTFAWERERERTDGDPIRVTFTADTAELLNISAYKPGDYHQFFDDPRTRAEYLEWAPLLLAAEDYHAGKREVPEPPPPKPKKEPSREGQIRYQQRKLRKAMIGKTVRLKRRIETTIGSVYEPGSLWRVVDGKQWTFTLLRLGTNGEPASVRVGGIHSDDFEVIQPSTPTDERQ